MRKIATALAHPNLALVKYWGKRDERLILPYTGSLGVTLGGCSSVTTVVADEHLRQDEFYFRESNGFLCLERDVQKYARVSRVLEVLRGYAAPGHATHVRIFAKNDFPASVGLAGGASGIAALAVAADALFETNLEKKVLSRVAREGSGSACRSVYGGFVEWKKGTNQDGSDSFAQQLRDENYWDEVRVLTAVVSHERKDISSTEGMRRSVQTSPLYAQWLERAQSHLISLRSGIVQRSFGAVGRIAEESSDLMHTVAEHADPPVVYRTEKTHAVLAAVRKWREEGLGVYYSVDAGPQVKVLCLEKQGPLVARRLRQLPEVKEIIFNGVGTGAAASDEHLV